MMEGLLVVLGLAVVVFAVVLAVGHAEEEDEVEAAAGGGALRKAEKLVPANGIFQPGIHGECEEVEWRGRGWWWSC